MMMEELPELEQLIIEKFREYYGIAIAKDWVTDPVGFALTMVWGYFNVMDKANEIPNNWEFEGGEENDRPDRA